MNKRGQVGASEFIQYTAKERRWMLNKQMIEKSKLQQILHRSKTNSKRENKTFICLCHSHMHQTLPRVCPYCIGLVCSEL